MTDVIVHTMERLLINHQVYFAREAVGHTNLDC